MNTRLLSTPLESVTGERYYAMLTLDTDAVYIHYSDCSGCLDRFSWEEWTQIVDAGRVNPETKRLVINW